MARKFLRVSRNSCPMRRDGKSRAILRFLWRKIVDDTGHDRTRRPAVTGHGRHLVEDAGCTARSPAAGRGSVPPRTSRPSPCHRPAARNHAPARPRTRYRSRQCRAARWAVPRMRSAGPAARASPRAAQPVPQRGLGQHEMEPLVRPVQHLLTPHARPDRLIDVIGHFEHGDALRETGPGVSRRLQ